MVASINEEQQFYFDRIQSKKLKTLISESYSFSTMNNDEKSEILINASVAHKIKEAEKELIEIFENEKSEIKDAVENTEPPTPEEEKQQFQTLNEENTAIKANFSKLNKEVNIEKENISKKQEEKKGQSLLKKLKKI